MVDREVVQSQKEDIGEAVHPELLVKCLHNVGLTNWVGSAATLGVCQQLHGEDKSGG